MKTQKHHPTVRLSDYLRALWPEMIQAVLVVAYGAYMIPYTIGKIYALHANYFDLGIMHQTVHNTYRAITNLDPSLILQLTDPHGFAQIYRPAIHNDILLALLAPFYFIHDGPETLLVIQTVALALGADLLFLIVKHVFKENRFWPALALSLSLTYLIYPAMNFTNQFEFHAVALATPLLLAVVYFWLTKRYGWMLVMAGLALIAKEQVGLTVTMFALIGLAVEWYRHRQVRWQTATMAIAGVSWFFFSLKVMMPGFRTEGYHFALSYFAAFGDDPIEIISTILTNPGLVWSQLAHEQTITYLNELLQPVAYLPLVAPMVLIAAGPELGINLLSENENLRNIYYHYDAVITPVIFLSTIATVWILARYRVPILASSVVIVVMGIFAAATYGPLPFSAKAQVGAFTERPDSLAAILDWQQRLSDEQLKIATSNDLAPFFSGRQYYYQMSVHYEKADYVLVLPNTVYQKFGSYTATPGYEALLEDDRYELVHDQDGFEVWERVE